MTDKEKMLTEEKTNKNRIRTAILRFGKKYYWLTALLIMAFFVFFIKAFVPTVHASDLDELKRKCDNLFSGFGMTNFEYMRLVYSAFKRFTAVDSAGVKSLRIVITAIGNLAVICFSLMNLAKESQRGEITLDYMFRVAATIVVACVLVTSVGTLMDYIYGAGDYIVSSVDFTMRDDIFGAEKTDTISSAAELSNAIAENKDKILDAMSYIPGLNGNSSGSGTIKELYNIDKLADADWFQVETADSILTLMSYIVYAPMLISIVLISSEIFWVKVRQIFAPIAVASIAYEGGRASGVRFLKKYLACFIKIAIYFLIAAIGAQMTIFFFGMLIDAAPYAGEDGHITPEAAIYLVLMIGSNIIAAMSMMQTGGLADEIVGV